MATLAQLRTGRRARTEDSGGPSFIDDLLAVAGSLVNSRKGYAIAQLESLAESVRQFSDGMPDIPTAKAYAAAAADGLDDLANYVSESELSGMLADARDFSRRHPLGVLGGSIVAGLLVTQLVQLRAQPSRPAAVSSRRRRSTAKTSVMAENPDDGSA